MRSMRSKAVQKRFHWCSGRVS